MAMGLPEGKKLVEIGFTALRKPNGDPLPSVPMYIMVDSEDVDPKTGLIEGEANMNGDIAKVLAPMFKQYMDGVEALERKKTADTSGKD